MIENKCIVLDLFYIYEFVPAELVLVLYVLDLLNYSYV